MTCPRFGMRAATALAAAFIWAPLACSPNTPPPPGGDFLGLDASSRRDAFVGAPGPTDDGGMATEDATQAESEGGAIVRGDGPLAPSPPTCVEGHAWAGGREWIADSVDRFGGVSATGWTVVWTRPTGDVMTADRSGEASDFMAPQALPSGSDPLAPGGRVALDATGTMAVGVDASGTGLVVWQRPAWGQAWTLGSAAPFDPILVAYAGSGITLSEPMFGASGDAFFYLVTPNGGVDATAPAPVLYESRLDATSGTWGVGVAISVAELTSSGPTAVRRPTGASSDDRTLFYFDGATLEERAAWRSDPSSPFTHFEDVAAAPEAAPNAGCSTLYIRGTNPEAGTAGINTAQ
jgi:hypothetical protein